MKLLRFNKVRWSWLLPLLILGSVLLGVRIVEPGTVHVVVRMGRVTGRTLSPGLNYVVPFIEKTLTYNTKLVTYETAIAEKQRTSDADYVDYPVDTNTLDGQPVDIAYTIRFSVDPTMATWIAQNIGNEHSLVEKIVKTESRIWARNVPREFEAEVLYTGKGSLEVQNKLEEHLIPVFSDNGLVLDRVGIREIYFDMEYVDAIRAKQVEAVKVETAKNTALKAEEEKKARITRAEGEAREQELQQKTLTDQLIRKMWIEKWNGVLPKVSGSEGLILDLGGLGEL